MVSPPHFTSYQPAYQNVISHKVSDYYATESYQGSVLVRGDTGDEFLNTSRGDEILSESKAGERRYLVNVSAQLWSLQ